MTPSGMHFVCLPLVLRVGDHPPRAGAGRERSGGIRKLAPYGPRGETPFMRSLGLEIGRATTASILAEHGIGPAPK